MSGERRSNGTAAQRSKNIRRSYSKTIEFDYNYAQVLGCVVVLFVRVRPSPWTLFINFPPKMFSLLIGPVSTLLPTGLGVPPASNVFNPMTFPGVVGAGGLLGLNFANRLNSTVGWPMMTTQVPQQQQQQPSHQPLQQLPPQRSPPAMVSQASHQAQPTPSPPQQQPLIGSPPASFFGAGGGGIPPQPQQLTFVSQPQVYRVFPLFF